MRYSVVLETASNGTIIATFPNVPEAHTVGNDEAQALERAPDALETALAIYLDEGRKLPPRPSGGRARGPRQAPDHRNPRRRMRPSGQYSER